MDKQIQDTLKVFYSNPQGFTTEEFYAEYRSMCEKANVPVRQKSTVIRIVCKALNLKVVTVRKHYFAQG